MTAALGLALLVVCACIIHWGYKPRTLRFATLGMVAGVWLVIIGAMVTQGVK